MPKAPAWFAKHLRRMNPTLGVRYNPSAQGWDIVQNLPRAVDQGSWDGMRLIEIKRVPQTILLVPELGSRVFSELNSLWAPKFDKNFEEFCKVNRVA